MDENLRKISGKSEHLTTRQTSIAHGAPKNKGSTRVDVNNGLCIHQLLGNNIQHNLLQNLHIEKTLFSIISIPILKSPSLVTVQAVCRDCAELK